MSKADQFKTSISPTRRPSFGQIMTHLEVADPDLLDAVNEALADEAASLAAIHRSLKEVGVDIGYSSLIRWRDHVRR